MCTLVAKSCALLFAIFCALLFTDYTKALTTYLDQNFKDLEIDNIVVIAKHFGINVNKLNCISRLDSGITVKSRIINFRLEYAKELLCSTKQPIKKIALEAGYSDPPYFSHCFKKKFKKTPGKYRK